MDPSGDEVEAVLEFWFGQLDESGAADAEHARRWFVKDEGFDREIRARFGVTHDAAAGGKREGWLAEARGSLAYVIVLDQFSRNLFRGDARAFAADARALAAAQKGVERGHDRMLRTDERAFLYMPFMHSEDLEMQDRSLQLFVALAADAPPAHTGMAANQVRYAERHREIIARFGRFPHRNAVLGRPSTAEEVEFLKQPDSGF